MKTHIFTSKNLEEDLKEANKIILNMKLAVDKYFSDNGYGAENKKRVKRWLQKSNDYMEQRGIDLSEISKEII